MPEEKQKFLDWLDDFVRQLEEAEEPQGLKAPDLYRAQGAFDTQTEIARRLRREITIERTRIVADG